MGVKIGCAGFAGRRETYFNKYPILEVEQSFYDPPRVATGEKWRREAPPRFEFIVRAWQLITHPATSPDYHRMQTRLRPHEAEAAGHFQPTPTVWNGWQRTRELANALQARTVLFHCPASFSPTREHKDHLRRFLQRVRSEAPLTAPGFTCAWEPPPEWTPKETAELSEEMNLVHAVDPFLHAPVTQGKCYFRLHGTKGYRHRYTEEELGHLVKLLEPFTSGYCVFDHLHMREDASRLYWQLRKTRSTPPASADSQTAAEPTGVIR